MDTNALTAAIVAVPALAPYAGYAAAFCGCCALICMALPPPKGPGWYAVLYAVMTTLGANRFYARNAADPAPTTTPNTQVTK